MLPAARSAMGPVLWASCVGDAGALANFVSYTSRLGLPTHWPCHGGGREPFMNLLQTRQTVLPGGPWRPGREAWLHNSSLATLLSNLADDGSWLFPVLHTQSNISNFTTWSPTVAEITGVQDNSAADLPTFLKAIWLNGLLFLAALTFFTCLRLRFPAVYCQPVLDKDVPQCWLRSGSPWKEFDAWIGWAFASYRITLDKAVDVVGLDHAMLLEFTHFSMKVLANIGVPMMFIMSPLHAFFAGGAAGDDRLSRIDMNNIEQDSWLYWVHAVVVWMVLLRLKRLVFDAQEKFLARRFRWFREMSPPRATTALVENIPVKHASEVKLKEYIENLFGREVVQSVSMVRHTGQLNAMFHNLCTTLHDMKAVEFKWKRAGRDSSERPELLDEYARAIKVKSAAIDKLRDEVLSNDDTLSHSGFVTFKAHQDREMFLNMRLTHDEDEYAISFPPDPSDVIYSDMLEDPVITGHKEVIGYLMLLGLFIGFLPIVTFVSSLTRLEALQELVPWLDEAVTKFPNIRIYWNALMGSFALTLFMALLPTFFMLIFTNFFKLDSHAWGQRRLEIWYFWFLMIFVVFVTALGSSIVDAASTGFQRPWDLIKSLATLFPKVTHFYLNFFPMQFVLSACMLTRAANLFKYLFFSSLNDEEAKARSEPEDQDAYGMGGRSAIMALLLVIPMVFCSLSPLICVLAFFYFAWHRLHLGYLVVFAESRKPDLGGVFWVAKLTQFQQGVFFYIVLMGSILLDRSSSSIPAIIVFSSLLYWAYVFNRFHHSFRWEILPFDEFISADSWSRVKREPRGATYLQPELVKLPSPLRLLNP